MVAVAAVVDLTGNWELVISKLILAFYCTKSIIISITMAPCDAYYNLFISFYKCFNIKYIIIFIHH